MPPRRDGTCRHCGRAGWVIGRGLCRHCYADPAVRARYRTFRPKRRRVPGAAYGHCAVCGRWRYIAARERCQTCYRLYSGDEEATRVTDPEREARIREYARRAARGQPLFRSAGEGQGPQRAPPGSRAVSTCGRPSEPGLAG
jgi:hypothetical protein